MPMYHILPLHRPGNTRNHRRGQALQILLLPVAVLGCHDLTGSQPLPAGTQSPATYNTLAGALGMRNAAIYAIEQAIPSYVVDAGLLTDELESNETGASQGVLLSAGLPSGGSLDERILPELRSTSGTNADEDYANLQAVRGNATQAIGALAAFDATAPSALRGELYALQGYAEIALADFFCSGVPLSTLDFQRDFTYHASSTTAQVYQDAVAKLDTAIALSTDSARILNLARVLKGRALLDLDSIAQAAQAVAAVPDGFRYQLVLQWLPGNGVQDNSLSRLAVVSDHEGVSGLPFISSQDPRTAVVSFGSTDRNGNPLPTPLFFPLKYDAARSPFTIADAIEARLIQAEAALQMNDPSWLTLLNTLRTTGAIDSVHADTTITATGTGTVDTTVRLDTAWHPGTGATELGIPGLRPLADPGTLSARVTLLFDERAYWLFLTGHRQGDLRRLIRQYGRNQNQVYPTGLYLAPGARIYGTDVTAPIPDQFETPNPLFHGCLSRGA